MSPRSTWDTKQILGWPEIPSETMSQKIKAKKKRKNEKQQSFTMELRIAAHLKDLNHTKFP